MHFHREIDQLKQLILKMGTIAEDRLRRACTLLKTMDEEEARRIIGADWEIDDMEIRVEEECLKILALHQPVARDLRLIVSIIKINTELERIADIAVNIAKRIVTIRKKADGQPGEPDVALLVEDAEKALFHAIVEVAPLARSHFHNEDYTDALRVLAGLRAAVDRFFDEVMVMVDDERVRRNRLALLAEVNGLFLRAAYVSRLQA